MFSYLERRIIGDANDFSGGREKENIGDPSASQPGLAGARYVLHFAAAEKKTLAPRPSHGEAILVFRAGSFTGCFEIKDFLLSINFRIYE